MTTGAAYLKLGQHRGRKRLWLEGAKLTRCRMTPGARVLVNYSESAKQITITLSDTGTKLVSGHVKNSKHLPIIDLSNQMLSTIFEGIERVRALFSDGQIVITVHADDLAKASRFESFKEKIKANIPLDMGSVAHGGGIMDHALHAGLELAGIKTRLRFAVELEHQYLEASLAIEGPMEEVEKELLPKVDILAAGIPCTGASVAGKSKNKLRHAEEHESAGALFFAFLNIVKASNPAVVILENVPGYQNTISMTVIRQVLQGWGYNIHETTLEGNALGALEARSRFCMVALTEGIEFDFSQIQAVREKEPNLGAVLEEIPADSPQWRSSGYLRDKEERDRAANKGFRMQIVGPDNGGCGTIGRGYSKVRSTEPKVGHPSNPDLIRQLTVAEHARVKSIPKSLVAGVSATTAHEILGQSVIHAAFVAVGRLLGLAAQNLLAAAAPQQISAGRQLHLNFGS